jgi:putative membrane protein
MGERVPYQAGDYGANEKKEKIAALRMLSGFVIAAKHHVRGEYGTEYEDLRAVLPHQLLARFKKQGYGYGAVE